MDGKMNNPEETIYLLLYGKPYYVKQICTLLYNKPRSSRVSGWITDLLEKEWITNRLKKNWIQSYMDLDEDKIRDRRYDYNMATPKGLHEKIIKYLNPRLPEDLKLTSDDKKNLLKYLDTISFRRYVFDYIQLAQKYNGIKTTINISHFLNMYSIECIHINHVALYFSEKGFQTILSRKENEMVSILGVALIAKLGVLNMHFSLISDHYNRFIKLVDEVEKHGDELKEALEDTVNKNKLIGNGHGLS